jgi:hypothetical protein
MKKIIVPIVIILFVALAIAYFSKNEAKPITPEYVEKVVENESLVVLETPKPNDVIESPMTISGQARGSWYFEASFPVVVKDEEGSIIGQGTAEAKGEWMTEEFVPFTGTITFTRPASATTGLLILERANPSGLPEKAGALEVPVIFE